MMGKIQYIFFENKISPILFIILLLIISAFYWHFSSGLRHRLDKRNYWIISILQFIIFAGLLILYCEPAVKKLELVKQNGRLAILFDGSVSTHLRNDSPWKIMYSKENPIKKNCNNYIPEYYIFSEIMKRLDDTQVLIPPMPPGTDIINAIETLIKTRKKNDDLKILLFSDGRDRIPFEKIDALKMSGVQIYTVGLGENNKAKDFVKDISIDDMTVNDYAILYNPTIIKGALSVSGFDNIPVKVDLLVNGTIIQNKVINSIAGKNKYDIDFSWIPNEARKFDIMLKVEPITGEKTNFNNSLVSKVSVMEKSNDVLFVQGNLNWEQVYLRKLLYRNSGLKVDTITFGGKNRILSNSTELKKGFPDKKQLYLYGGVILGDTPLSYFTEENIADLESFVKEKGGGLIILGGEQFFDKAVPIPNLIRAMLPIIPSEWNSFKDRSVKFLKVNTEIFSVSILKNISNEKEGVDLPVNGVISTGSLKNNSRTILDLKEKSGMENLIPAAYQRYGLGKVIYIGFDTSWKWTFNSRFEKNKIFYEKFWKSLVSFILNFEPNMNFEDIKITKDNNVHIKDKLIKFSIKISERYNTIIKKENLNVYVTDSSKQKNKIAWSEGNISKGEINVSYIPNDTGEYLLEVEIQSNSGKISDNMSFYVREDLYEYEDISINEALLKLISFSSGGEYRSYNEFLNKPFVFTRNETLNEKEEIKDILSSEFVFVVFVFLFAISWIVKRSINSD